MNASTAGSRHSGRSRGPERGQSTAELGFLLPVLLLVVVGIVEVAGSMNTYLTLVNAARDGARLGSKGLATDDQIRNLVVTETARLRDPVDPTDDVNVVRWSLGGEDSITVEVCNDRSLLLGIPLILPDSFRMCSKTTMRIFPPQPY